MRLLKNKKNQANSTRFPRDRAFAYIVSWTDTQQMRVARPHMIFDSNGVRVNGSQQK